MTHVRSSIRSDAIAAVTGLTTTGSNVYDSRSYTLSQAQLPCWLVYTNDEEIERASTGGLLQRRVELVLEGVARATANIDDTLDTMLEEAETALLLSAISGAKAIDLAEIQTQFTDEGDAPFGSITATYVVTYHTNEGAPTTAL